MKVRRILSAIVLGVVGLACMPGANIAEAATASSKTDVQRKKSLDDALRRIDKRAESQINRVLDGQKGLGNSGASSKKIAQIERQRDADKKALIDHYNKGRTGVVGLDGKLKNPGTPAANGPVTTGRVGLDGKLKPAPAPAPKAPHYVVGLDGKRKLVP